MLKAIPVLPNFLFKDICISRFGHISLSGQTIGKFLRLLLEDLLRFLLQWLQVDFRGVFTFAERLLPALYSLRQVVGGLLEQLLVRL